MQPDYQQYSVEDFTRDEHFRGWVMQADPASEAFWSAWVTAHPEAAGKVQLARAFLYALEEKNTALPADELTHITDTILQQNKPLHRPLWATPLFRLAASVLVVMGLGYMFRASQTGSGWTDGPDTDKLGDISPVLAANFREAKNTGQEPHYLTLQDGSRITLYKNSTLRYPVKFEASQREVYLTGQAFFDITKNPKKPFWVHADHISTQVLGTSFLITTEGETTKVAVRAGRVSVYTRRDIKQARQSRENESVGVVLTANQQVSFSEQEDRLVKSIVQQPLVLNPIQPHTYAFDEAPIGRVFKQLEDTYGLSVLYDPVTVKNCFVTANLDGESLFRKLDLICKITRSTYEIVDGQIIIHSLGCDNN